MTKPVAKTNGGMNLFTTGKAIAAATAEIKTRGVSYQIDLHVLACSVLQHVGKNKDMRVLAAFIDAVPDVVRKNALYTWFDKFGPVTFLGADGKALDNPAYVGSKPVKLGDAMEKPFWKIKANEGMPYEPLVLDTYIESQIKKLTKDATETKRDHTGLIAALRAAKVVALPV